MRPTVFKAIMTVASQHDEETRKLRANAFREDVGLRILVRGERNLDMLQGLLVYVSW
jgi:hypothetical protein